MKVLKIVLLFVAILFSVCCVFALQVDEGDIAVGSKESDSGEVIILNKADFLQKVFNYEKNKDEWVYEGDTPCIIDFYADWCPPCKTVDPILKDLAKEYDGKLIIYKINTDNERELATVFGIRNIPTYLFVPAKGQPQSAIGAMPRESFVKVIDDFLLK